MTPGWSTYAYPDEAGNGIACYSTVPSTPFRSPIPINGADAPLQPVANARYFHRTTKRAYFILGNEFISIALNCPAVRLTTSDCSWAGILRLNCLPFDCGDFLSQHRRIEGGRCELIEISAGSVEDRANNPSSFDEWDERGCGRRDGLYEFINVLWIERIEGIAYRKVLGRVRRDVWEDEARASIKVTLG
jgi:hypothetical protein